MIAGLNHGMNKNRGTIDFLHSNSVKMLTLLLLISSNTNDNLAG